MQSLECQHAVASLIASCDIIEMLHDCSTNCKTDYRALHRAIMDRARRLQEIYGGDIWTPKMHYVLHLADQYRHFGRLQNCFVHERKHKSAKAFANRRECTKSFERGLLEDLTHEMLENLINNILRPELPNPKRISQKMHDELYAAGRIPAGTPVYTAPELYLKARKVCNLDVVLFEEGHAISVGQIMFHFNYGTMYFSCLKVWRIAERHATKYSCIVLADAYIIPSDWIIEAVVHSHAEVGQYSHVLLPLHMRS